MKYSLDVRIIGDKNYLDSVKTELPSQNDPAVDPDLYDEPTITENEEGNLQLTASIKFTDDTARDSVKTAIMQATNDLNDTLPGSYVRFHECHHDEDPPKPCKITQTWEVS